MARLLIATAMLVATSPLLAGTAAAEPTDTPISTPLEDAVASPPIPDTTQALADEAQVDPLDLEGARLTLGIQTEDALRAYLYAVGDLSPPPSLSGDKSPHPAATAQVLCIESKESGGENVWHGHTPPPPGQDKAGGVMQYFEKTFEAHAAEMGHPEWSRWVPWQAEAVAAYDLAMKRRSQWTVSGC